MSIGQRQVDAHRNGDCWSPTCAICELEDEQADEEPTCDDCGDPIEDGTGCHHEGDYCATCFLHHCRDCARDMADDMRAEARMDRDR